MIRLVEALNYRCLRYLRVPLTDFQILIGPNASGKTTFLDVVMFLSDLLSGGLEEAITARSTDIRDLFFAGEGDRFELAVELEIPQEVKEELKNTYAYVRYEIAVGIDREAEAHQIFDEQVILLPPAEAAGKPVQRVLFPQPQDPPSSLLHPRNVGGGKKRVVRKVHGGNDNFYSEVKGQKGSGGWSPSLPLGPRKSALGNMPEDPKNFPVSTWLRETLKEATQHLTLNSLALRKSSRPGQGLLYKADGANLPWVIQHLREKDSTSFQEWIEHVQTALPDVEDITTVEVPDNRHRYLQLQYANGLQVPSWVSSDGTLRLLALTLPAYLPSFKGVYLIEEPENGIHPRAMETVFQALKTVWGAQILVATHSPVIVGCAETRDIICFKKDEQGATDCVNGAEHPELKEWRGTLHLSDLYASGVLG